MTALEKFQPDGMLRVYAVMPRTGSWRSTFCVPRPAEAEFVVAEVKDNVVNSAAPKREVESVLNNFI